MTDTPTAEKTADGLSDRQRESRKEIVIPIRPKELYKAYADWITEKPVEGYKAVARFADSIATPKRMRTGFTAVVKLPLGIMGRNAARAAHYVADKKLPGGIGGVLGAGAAWWFAGKAAFAWATTSAPGLAAVASQAGVIGAATKIATLVGTTVLTGLAVVPPAFMIGTIVTATAAAAVIGVASVVPALINIKTGILRTVDRFKGIKGVDYDGQKEEEEITYNSLRAREERRLYNDIGWKVDRLSEEHQKELFTRLTEKFGKAAEKAAPAQDDPAPVAQPAAKGVSVTPNP